MMGHPHYSTDSARPFPDADCHWAWLQSRLEQAAVLEASHELDEWFGKQLDELELQYADLVTVSSIKGATVTLVKDGRR